MEMDRLKIELLQKIIDCNDTELLLRLKEFLADMDSEVKEETGEYSAADVHKDVAPDSYYQKLEQDFEKYQKGELKARPWEEFHAELRRKYDL